MKLADDGPGEISGYRAVFSVIDEGGAAQAAKMGRSMVYAHRRNDPAFASAWDQALDQAADFTLP